MGTAIGSKAPASLLNFYFKYTFCRKGLKRVRSNGMGVHTAEEIENFGKKDLQTLSEMLGDKEFFFGSEPAMLDLVVFSQVGQLVMVDKEHACPLRDFLEADCKNLVGLVNRMKDRCWGDHWDNATGEEMDLNPHIPKPEPPAPEEEKKEEEAKAESKEDEKKEDEKEKAEEKKEEKEKVNMLTKLQGAWNKLKPQPAAPAAEKAAESEPKAEAEATESKEEEKKEEAVEEKKENKDEETKESEEKK